MKKIFIPIVIAFVAVVFACCDKIEGPFYEAIINEDVFVNIFPPLDLNTVYRKVLLEEYTGHSCTNCPDGHQKLEQLHEIYGDTLITIGLHTGAYARPTNSRPHDFRTAAGDALATEYGISAWPTAIVNRQKNSSGGLAISNWQSAIQNVDRSTVSAAIQMVNQFNTTDSTLKVNVKVTVLEDCDNPVYLALYLVEDGIVSPQLYGNETIDDYVHNHVMRGDINGTYGETLTNNGFLYKGETHLYAKSISLKYRSLNPDPANDSHLVQPNIDNCYVVAILYDKINSEVLQVEKMNIR